MDLPEPEAELGVGKGVEFCGESEDGEVGERRREGEKVEEEEDTDLRGGGGGGGGRRKTEMRERERGETAKLKLQTPWQHSVSRQILIFISISNYLLLLDDVLKLINQLSIHLGTDAQVININITLSSKLNHALHYTAHQCIM